MTLGPSERRVAHWLARSLMGAQYQLGCDGCSLGILVIPTLDVASDNIVAVSGGRLQGPSSVAKRELMGDSRAVTTGQASRCLCEMREMGGGEGATFAARQRERSAGAVCRRCSLVVVKAES